MVSRGSDDASAGHNFEKYVMRVEFLWQRTISHSFIVGIALKGIKPGMALPEERGVTKDLPVNLPKIRAMIAAQAD